jgi:hypothetical protein
VALVCTDVSGERSASIIRVTRIIELGTTLEVTSNRVRCKGILVRLLVTDNVAPRSPILAALLMGAIRSAETLVLTVATGRNILEDGILQSLSCDYVKFFARLLRFILRCCQYL